MPAKWRALSVATAVGVFVVATAWWLSPGLFDATRSVPETRVVTATVISPSSCTETGAEEIVRFVFSGQKRKGVLTACGHDENEQIRVAVPVNPGSGTIEVRSATSSRGFSSLRIPLGLLLLTMSCCAGAGYALLLVRGGFRRARPAVG